MYPTHSTTNLTTQATGKIGSHFLKHILASGTHNITVLTRPGSNLTLPDGVAVVEVDYTSESSITSALRNQDFLTISLSVATPPGTHARIVSAAAAAGVPYVMPNYYGFGLGARAGTLATDPLLSIFSAAIDDVRNTDGVSFVALCCGFWYEFSLAMGEEWYGFDIGKRRVTFYGDGTDRVSTTTWEQCGRALAALLRLPVSREAGPAVEDWRDQGLHISSFLISQRDMLDSLNRVLGTTDDDWDISYQDVKERHQIGLDELQKGNRRGFAKAMYASVFVPGAGGDYETGYEMDNVKLGLPREDLDEATRRAVQMAKEGINQV
jgi:nucleoside-diphosphate-sugar epimerase